MRVLLRLMLALSLAVAARAREEVPGKITDRVVCDQDPRQSYALYLPAAYSARQRWPVIFCFDPGARGGVPVAGLQAAAEKFGYIVAGSLNSRNGPWADNLVAIGAILTDVSTHYPLDARRTFAAGLSGGARVATQLALAGAVRGVIACSAGFPVPGEIPRRIPFAFFGTTGTEDFNYQELRQLDGELADRHSAHRIVVFPGGHEWAPAEVLTQGIEWLNLQAIRTGAVSRDDAAVRAMLATRFAALPVESGLDRWRELKSLAADFAGLADTAGIEAEAGRLGASREVRSALQAERTRAAREAALNEKLAGLGDEDANRVRTVAVELRAEYDALDDTAERRMVRRAVGGFMVNTRESMRGLLERREYARAESLLEVADALRPDQARTLLDLARVRACRGEKKTAVVSLARAAAVGFNDAARISSDPAFAKLAGNTDFEAVLGKIRANSENPGRPRG